MLKTEGVNHVIAQSVNHVSLDMVAAPTVQKIFIRAIVVAFPEKVLTKIPPAVIIHWQLRECWNGRQARLRCVWLRRGGSSPLSRTKSARWF